MALDDNATETRTSFHAMSEGTLEDWQAIGEAMKPHADALPDRVLKHLSLLQGDYGGYAVDRLEHSLQTATRAHLDGKDGEYVVCALLHDIGDTLGPHNHADIAATILEPFVSEENHWIVKHHGIFQGYYFFHYIGLDRNLRDQYKDHPSYGACAQFCHLYDQNSFDPDYDSKPLSFFEPMVREVLARPKKSLYKKSA